MKCKTIITMTLLALTATAQAQNAEKAVRQVDFSQVKITDDFWAPRLERHVTTTQPVCIDQIENQTDRIRNYINVARGNGKHSGIFFDDSDVYKALEGMAYSLINHPDKQIEAKADEWIDIFAKAQLNDGYINTYFTLTGLDKRWTDMDKHEMYCAGHMIEAAVAYYHATGKDKLLKVCQRMADHMMTIFGPGKRHWVPGHEEIELALVKLYETTGEEKYLDFAYWLLEERGHGHGFRPDGHWSTNYYQDLVPVRDLKSISGHAVRLMYLFCGMADMTAYKETGYIETLDELWHDVVDRNMYITGGIGQTATNEGFSDDYSLPNATAYCETCASIGMVLWNYRMNQFTGDAKYIDILERAMYNGVLAGINLRGDRFFYVNPLESAGNHHRQEWFGCACCPSNITRFLPSIGNYIYGTSNDALWVNLYVGNESSVKIDGQSTPVVMKTQYPWDGSVNLTFRKAFGKKDLRLRIPGWCKDFTIAVNGKPVKAFSEDKGYAVINRNWRQGDEVQLRMTMPVERVSADPRVKEDEGMQAIQRGPLVYCAEAIDNGGSFDDFQLTPATRFTLRQLGGILNGITGITADNGRQLLRLIPYYAWDNREASKMKVWIKETDQ
ncbi:MAG: glycoside hydrolase family 127 protein [Prevotella sp.]|nr:glycoside hydrolase family 127 protein [Prevotella sp.]